MTTAELLDLIASLRTFETDTLHVEAKRAEGDLPRRLWETLSAFSNTPGGGVIILGLDEMAGFAAVGVRNPRKMLQDLGSLCGELDPPLRPAVDLHQVEGKTLVVAEVPELEVDHKPCYYRGAGLTNGAFIRVADGDRKLTSYEVHMLLASRGQPREDEVSVPEASVADLDQELVAGLLERLRPPEGSVFRRLSDEQALQTLKVLMPQPAHRGDQRRRDGDRADADRGQPLEQLVPSLGGLLVLGRYPQQFFPQVGVTFVVYPTERVGEPGPGGERFLDNRRFDGPIPLLVQPVLAALQRNMKRRAVVRGLYREDLWEYPETAIREAVVNALAHRDLSPAARGTPVQIQMFPDRLTIVNPGGLYGPVTVERLGEAGVSATRNQTLMKLLEDAVVPGEGRALCENRGSGIGAMLAALRQAGMSPPRFENRIATFEVTFPNHTLLDADTLRWLGELERYGAGGARLTDSQRMGLAIMHQGDSLTNVRYRQATGIDSRVATRELGELVDRGLAELVGTRRWASYRLAPGVPVGPGGGVGSSETGAAVSDTRPTGATVVRRPDVKQRIQEVLRERDECSRAELAALLGLTDAVVRKWLGVLRSEGRVTLTTESPHSRNARYRLAPAARGD